MAIEALKQADGKVKDAAKILEADLAAKKKAEAEEKPLVRRSSTAEEKAAKEAERIENLWKRSEIPCHPC